jgi:hypothetical protein
MNVQNLRLTSKLFSLAKTRTEHCQKYVKIKNTLYATTF